MTTGVVEVNPDDTLVEVARLMRDNGVGAVVVTDGGKLLGIVTDRDIVVRAVAEGLDPQRETVDTVFSGQDLITVTPDTTMDDAIDPHATQRGTTATGGRRQRTVRRHRVDRRPRD